MLIMSQAIKGKAVVRGKAAMTLRQALKEPKGDPDKVKRLKSALQFHREVKHDD